MRNYNRNSHVHNALQKIIWRKVWRKKPIRQCIKVALFYLHQNLFNIKKHLALVHKKIVHILFCVFQTNLNKAVNIFCTLSESYSKCTIDAKFQCNKDLNENLAQLTQKTKELKHSNKKVAILPFLHQPPFSGLSPLSSKNFGTLPSDSIFRRSNPACNKGGPPTMGWHPQAPVHAILKTCGMPHI